MAGAAWGRARLNTCWCTHASWLWAGPVRPAVLGLLVVGRARSLCSRSAIGLHHACNPGSLRVWRGQGCVHSTSLPGMPVLCAPGSVSLPPACQQLRPRSLCPTCAVHRAGRLDQFFPKDEHEPALTGPSRCDLHAEPSLQRCWLRAASSHSTAHGCQGLFQTSKSRCWQGLHCAPCTLATACAGCVLPSAAAVRAWSQTV